MLEALKNEEEFENIIKNEYKEINRNEEKEKNKLDESIAKTKTCGNIEEADETIINEIDANLDQIIKENTEQNDKVVTEYEKKAETDYTKILKSKKDDYKVHLVSEMRSIDHVIEKYYSLKNFKSRKTTNVKRLRPTINALRSLTEAFLCKYHHNEKFTLFYRLINPIKSRCRKQNLQKTKNWYGEGCKYRP